MPARIGLSVWLFQVLYALRAIYFNAFEPPYHSGTVTDHRFGATLMLAAVIVALGRRHWLHVLGCMVRPARRAEDRRDRWAGWMFAVGCGGVAGWLLWVGVSPAWALVLTAFGFAIALVIARIVAETGMPFIRLQFLYVFWPIRMVPATWLSLPVMYFSAVIMILFPLASRVGVSVMATHALGLQSPSTPRRQSLLMVGLVGVLLLGLVISGAAHLRANYHHAMTLNGREAPINTWGTRRLEIGQRDADALRLGRVSRRLYNQPAHVALGAGLAGGLYWMCLRSPAWPIHPIGLLMVNSFYANEAWASVFFGWLLKALVLKYGGAGLYRRARPFFIGVIMGEVIAAIFWVLEPAIRALLGLEYVPVQIQPY
jgi:hypothetical protein